MTLATETPRSTAFEGRAAGREDKASTSLAQGFYHSRGGRASSKRAVVVDTPVGRRTVGRVEDGVFRKRVKKSEHLLRCMDAWGFQAELLPQLRNAGVQQVVVTDTEDGVTYTVGLDVIEVRGVVRDLGHGEQVFVARKFFSRSDTERQSSDAPRPQQPSLFGEGNL